MELLRKSFRPILFKINKKIGSIFLGNYRSHFKGRGIEFAESRLYVEGDDPKYIHWNLSAKEGQLYVKLFEETKELTSYIAFDISDSMYFKEKFNLALEISVILSISAIKNSDKLGLILYENDKILKIYKPKKGKKYLMQLLNEILYFNKDAVRTYYHIDSLKKIIKHSTIVFFISDMIGFTQYNLLHYLNIKNQIDIFRIFHPEERGLLQDKIYDFEINNYKKYVYGSNIKDDFKHIIHNYFKKQNDILNSKKIRFCEISTNSDPYHSLLQYFQYNIKK